MKTKYIFEFADSYKNKTWQKSINLSSDIKAVAYACFVCSFRFTPITRFKSWFQKKFFRGQNIFEAEATLKEINETRPLDIVCELILKPSENFYVYF